MASSYSGAKIALATMHRKEAVIGPAFRQKLGAEIVVPEIDTDLLGTFSGEVTRHADALQTAIKKAKLAMQAKCLPYGLASEGSFGPHPIIPFLPCDNELMVFVDNINGFTLHEIIISEETNYKHGSFTNISAMKEFAQQAQFPSHALIMRPEPAKDKKFIIKGIQDNDTLESAFLQCHSISKNGTVWVETDMRAHFNPSRMNVISALAEKLADRLTTLCSSCKTPGWGQVGREAGLKCEACSTPTEMTLYEIFGCIKCKYQEKHPRKDGLKLAPASQCQWCNP